MQNFFKRYENKYIIDTLQYELLMHFVSGKMEEDEKTGCTVSDLYYDTDDYDLIRTSVEKQAYKETLKLRTYDALGITTPTYIELKKKTDAMVYKTRFETDMVGAFAFLSGYLCPITKPEEEKSMKEILNFLERHDVHPKALITYDRIALYGNFDEEFRMTFDSNISYRKMDKDAISKNAEKPILEPEKIIMEIKSPNSIPIWLSKILSELEIFPVSISKYGEAYKTYVANKMFITKKDMYVGSMRENLTSDLYAYG